MVKKRILLTGASGFVGSRYMICSGNKHDVLPFSVTKDMPSAELLSAQDTIIHLGGLAHQMQQVDPAKYFEANFEKTKQLAILAKNAGVKHFIFISTIKVFGEHQQDILSLESPCLPVNDPYGESKLKAEQFLRTLESTGFMVSIIRPPLIYGPGVKGNLAKLLDLCSSNYPLPFKHIPNRRTMVYLDNFIAFIDHLVENPVNGIFLAGDAPLSTEQLVTSMRKYMGKPANLFAVPYFLRSILKSMRPALEMRLFGSLEMDSATSYKKINFVSPYSTEEGIKAMVASYLANKPKK